mmetsp:Transcript_12612/g.19056  ORF Transcript_12612/g.19056 Transcript_12612/m.19056 type:complete len:191 (+) Transcript_12612:49-621(+)
MNSTTYKSGWLVKVRKFFSKKRYIVLNDRVLHVYKHKVSEKDTDTSPFEQIILDDCVVQSAQRTTGKKYSLEVVPNRGEDRAKAHYFIADSEQECIAWMSALQAAAEVKQRQRERSQQIIPTILFRVAGTQGLSCCKEAIENEIQHIHSVHSVEFDCDNELLKVQGRLNPKIIQTRLASLGFLVGEFGIQ